MKISLMKSFAIIIIAISLSRSYIYNTSHLSADKETLFEEELISERKIDFSNEWEFRKYEEKIDLPHDYSINQDFNEHLEGESGFLPGGDGIYRKTFKMKKLPEKSSVIITFYGVYKDAYIFMNGKYLGENHYGYNTFSFDLSDNIIDDDQTNNILEVRVSHDLYSSRWYSGSGIFRGVEMSILNPIHINLDGVIILTPNIKEGKGTVKIITEVVNNLSSEEEIKLVYTIKDQEGKVIRSFDSSPQKIEGKEIKKIEAESEVENPKLWSDVSPYLYSISIAVEKESTKYDEYQTKFGIRYYTFDKERGFSINNVPTKLFGVSIHHDLGALGSIENYDATYKRFKQLKDMGCNAIRTTHNIASKIWIELADELGMFVIEEEFDGWSFSKNGNSNDFGKYFNTEIASNNFIIGGKPGMTWAEFAIKSVVKRDRNNPSIIMWSIGNEIGSYEPYPEIARNLIKWGKEYDTSRPFTSGDNECMHPKPSPYNLKVIQAIHESGGVVGYNYAHIDAMENAARIYGSIYLSESASAINSRGIYSLRENGGDRKHDGKYHLTSYDESWVPWGTSAHHSLWYTVAYDFMAGQFVWTGYDYIGEPTPWNGDRPGSVTGKGPIPNSAYFGIIDTCGFPKDSYYLYRAQCNHKSITVHLVTAWDKNNICFSDSERKKTFVDVYTNAPKVEIYRSDRPNVPICSMTRKIEKTNAGYIYYTYTQESLDGSCTINDHKDPGSLLYNKFFIEFLDGTKLFTKSYDENGNLIDNKNIVGTHSINAPHLDKIKIQAVVDKNTINANGKSLAYIELAFVDDEGTLNTVAENLIEINLEGEGIIRGVDNGDQATAEKFQQKSVLTSKKSAHIKAYAGRALVIVSGNKTPGNITLTISSKGYDTVTLNIKTE